MSTYNCQHCHDTRRTTIVAMCGGVEMDCDEQPCPWCADEEPDQPGEKHGN